MVAAFPASNNVFVPNHEATGKLVVDFSRKPSKFAVSRYTQIVPVKQSIGYYLKMTVEEAGRIVNVDGADFAWPDNADAPSGVDGTESHEFLAYTTLRRAFPFQLGDKTTDQATWDIIAKHAAVKAQQAMTMRTQAAVTALTTSGNYPSGHYSAVGSISGNTGNWAASTTARQDIKRSLHYAAQQILKSTLAGVEINDLILVLSPGCAAEISRCQEIVDHIKGSPEALAQVRGEGANAIFGLPDKLYGFPVVVDATVKVTSRKGATRAASYVLADSTPFMVARPGGLEGVAGAPSFSTFTFFMYEEMGTETYHDVNNRNTKGRVVEDYAGVVTAPTSGFLFTSAV